MNTKWTDGTSCACTDGGTVEPHAWPRLNSGEIHVWNASLDGSAHEQDQALLSPDETERAGRYRFARDRLRFMAGRARLRTILGGYLGCQPAELSFLHGPHGKPRLATNEWEEPLHFNMTHADSLALYAVTRAGEVGIDIERIREIQDWAGIAGNFFAPGEQARLRRLTAGRRTRAFLQAWTRREALLKASGEGLIGENDGRSSVRDSGFSIHSFAPAPGYLAALASEFSAQRVIFITWTGTPGSTGPATVET